MWGYYGSKSKIVNKYPEPEYGKIIEPFAGTAQYSLKYWDRDIVLIEKYDVIVKLWKWLQQCSKEDILGLPRLKWGENVDNFTWDCEEAKWLVGFIITGAPSQPKKTASKWKTVIRPNTQDYKLNMIAENLHKIKHWDIRQGDFNDLENEEATWFIDPPYQFGGEYYKFGNKNIDFKELGEWCMNRNGQRFIDYFTNKQIIHLNSNDFQLYLDNYNFTSTSQQNQIINAIKFLYVEVLNKKYNKVSFKRPKSEKKLPQVIDVEFILDKLSKIENAKHKAILTLTFSVGLRVSEIINLKIEDIDSKRMMIHIKNAKGKKDRIVPLSQNVLDSLRIYYKEYKPKEYLFNGQGKLQYSIKSCQNIFKKYIDDESHIHILRHSCFTSLIENGVDIRVIQKIAGHSHIKTTEIYTHVSNNLLSKINLPI